MTYYFYDEDFVRYQLYRSRDGKAFNWLFFPGGPGADSRYLTSLIDILEIPGNIWLIDLPGNGDNTENIPAGYLFDKWFEILPKIPARFDNPIYVGHSFGGMMPLMYPQLASILSGLVVLNAAPTQWLDATREAAQKFNLPDLSGDLTAFSQNPIQATFDKALSACMPYYFPKQSLDLGKSMLSGLPFSVQAAVWGQWKAMEICAKMNWVPNNIPMLVVGGEYDAMTPFKLFAQDSRFKLPNIKMFELPGAGHMPWIEKPKEIQNVFFDFLKTILA